MSFNVIKLKNRNPADCWIELIGADGKPAVYAPDATKEQLDKYATDLSRFESGELKKAPKVDFDLKPVRLKLKSIYSSEFKKAQRHRKMKDQLIAQGISKSALTEIKKSGEVDLTEFFNKSTNSVLDSIDDGIELICENALDWEGFLDEESTPIPFDAELLKDILTDSNNIAVYSGIMKAIETDEVFFTA